MKNWEKEIIDETSELFDLFLRLHAHEKAIERIRERIVCIENSIYKQRPKDYVAWVSLISDCRILFSMLEGKVINFFRQLQDG